MKKRIAVFYHNTNLSTVPSLVGFLDALVQNGFKIDLFTGTDKEFQHVACRSPEIDLFGNYWRCRPYGVYRLFPETMLWPLIGLQKQLRTGYDCVIGVDPEGIIDADKFVRYTGVPLIYFSLEIMSFTGVTGLLARDHDSKKTETKACRRCCAAIVQDPARGALLAEACGIATTKHFYLPNAPLGQASPRSFDYWHRLFDLSSEKKVLLHAGSLYSWTMITDIAATARQWPDNWVLVIHGRYAAGSVWQLLGETIEKLSPPGKVLFSKSAVDLNELDVLYASANAVLACYQPMYDSWYHGANLRILGLSSGKVGFALRNGVPVVTNDKTDLGGYVTERKVGVSIATAADLSSALHQIDANLEWKQHCLDVYKNDWAIEDEITKIIGFINTLK